MKKLILFIVPVMLFSLTACNKDTQEEKTGQVVCTLSMNDVVNGYNIESEYKINYKGDFVESVDTVETVTSESQDIIDSFENTFFSAIIYSTNYQTFQHISYTNHYSNT